MFRRVGKPVWNAQPGSDVSRCVRGELVGEDGDSGGWQTVGDVNGRGHADPAGSDHADRRSHTVSAASGRTQSTWKEIYLTGHI